MLKRLESNKYFRNEFHSYCDLSIYWDFIYRSATREFNLNDATFVNSSRPKIRHELHITGSSFNVFDK